MIPTVGLSPELRSPVKKPVKNKLINRTRSDHINVGALDLTAIDTSAQALLPGTRITKTTAMAKKDGGRSAVGVALPFVDSALEGSEGQGEADGEHSSDGAEGSKDGCRPTVGDD